MNAPIQLLASHMWTSHVKHINESCHTHKQGRYTSHLCPSLSKNITHMNESCQTNESRHTYKWVTSHMWIRHVTEIEGGGTLLLNIYAFLRHVTHMSKSCHRLEEVMSSMWMSYVMHMNESRHACEWVTSRIWMNFIKHTNESRHTYIWISQVTHSSWMWRNHVKYEWVMSHMNDSCHAHEWVMSRIVTHSSCRTSVWLDSFIWDMICIWMNHVTYEWVTFVLVAYEWIMSHMNGSCHAHEWVMSRMNETCHTWMSHVVYICVMSHMHQSCHICELIISHIKKSCHV